MPIVAALVVALILSGLAITRNASTEEIPVAGRDLSLFLKIDGIDGESIDENHWHWIEIDAFNWSEVSTSIVSGIRTGVVNVRDFVFTMRTNKASPALLLAVAKGTHYMYAQLDVCTAGESQLKFLEFRLDDVIVTSYSIAGQTFDNRPLEQFSLSFTKITMTYWPIEFDGSLGAATTVYYNLQTRSGGFI